MTPDSTLTSIRFAGRADALAIAEMSRDLIEHGLGWSWTRERILRGLRHPDVNVIVAVRDAERAGFAVMKYGDDEAHLLLLAVRPGHARHGVGRTLVDWLEATARVAGILRISLEARVGNTAARAFYARLGFTPTQLMPGYYGGREASVRMGKQLGSRHEAAP
jgi:ribosomal-protein-alanine N-acetyltransferase